MHKNNFLRCITPFYHAYICIDKGYTLRNSKELYLPGGYLTSDPTFYTTFEKLLLEYINDDHDKLTYYFTSIEYFELIDHLFLEEIQTCAASKKTSKELQDCIKSSAQEYLKRRISIFSLAYIAHDGNMIKAIQPILESYRQTIPINKQKIWELQQIFYTKTYVYYTEDFFHTGFLIPLEGKMKLSSKKEIDNYWSSISL